MAFAAIIKPKTAKRFPRWPIVRNADSPQAKGLRAWWPLYRLDDAYDLGPAGKFRLVRQAAGVTWVADGQRGFVASFDNTSNAKFQGTGLAPLAAPPITITGWFVHSSSATVDRIFSIADGSSDTIRAWTTSANKMLVQEIGATANEKVVGSIGITTSSWMHFAFTTDGANKELFIDGVSDKTGSVNVGAHSWVDVAVGGTAWTSGANYNGELSDWRIYDRILSSSEIAFLVEEPWDLFHEIGRRTIIIFGAAGATKQLAGVSTTQTTGAGLLVATRGLVGASATQTTGAGVAQAIRRLVGASTTQTTGSGNLTKTGTVSLAGVSSTQTTGAGALSRTVSLSGASATQSTGAGVLKITRKLSGASTTQTTGSGNLTKSGIKQLAGVSTTQTTGSGNLTKTGAVSLAGISSVQTTGAGALRKTATIAGASTTQVTGAGAIARRRGLNGASTTQTTSTGTTRRRRGLVGLSETQTTGTAIIHAILSLMGVSTTETTGSGALVGADVLPVVRERTFHLVRERERTFTTVMERERTFYV